MNETLEKISAQSVLSGTGKIDLARMARITGWRVTSLGKRISWKKKANQNFAMALELLAENGLLYELERRIQEGKDE